MDDLIKRARELDSKACSGPWRHCCASGDGCGGVMVWEEGDEESPVASASKGHVNAKNNMAFIAESRTLLPALADLAESEGRRADEADDKLRNVAEAFRQWDEQSSMAVTTLLAIRDAIGYSGKGQQP